MWIATFVGVVFGIASGNLLFAALGFIAGRWIDRQLARYFRGSSGSRAAQEAAFFRACFLLHGCLAKVDGQVSRAEIAHTEQLMARLGLTPEHRQDAIQLFQEGVSPAFDLTATLTSFNEACGNRPDIKRILLGYLVGLALADGRFHAKEELLLRAIAQGMGLESAQFERLIRMIRAQAHFSSRAGSAHGAKSGAESPRLALAYEALGASESDSEAELKRRYRRLMSEHHPDKLIGKGVPEDMVRMATERAQEIRQAYDTICEYRRAATQSSNAA